MVLKAEEIQNDIDKNSTTFFQKELERKKEFLPEFNLSAKSAAKIYNMDSLLPPSDANRLNLAVLDNPKALLPYCLGIKDAISWDTLTEELNLQKKRYLAYLNHLMQFYRIRKIDVPVAELSNSHKIPLEVCKSIVDKFYEPLKKEGDIKTEVTFSRGKKQETKLICHILILSLTL